MRYPCWYPLFTHSLCCRSLCALILTGTLILLYSSIESLVWPLHSNFSTWQTPKKDTDWGTCGPFAVSNTRPVMAASPFTTPAHQGSRKELDVHQAFECHNTFWILAFATKESPLLQTRFIQVNRDLNSDRNLGNSEWTKKPDQKRIIPDEKHQNLHQRIQRAELGCWFLMTALFWRHLQQQTIPSALWTCHLCRLTLALILRNRIRTRSACCPILKAVSLSTCMQAYHRCIHGKVPGSGLCGETRFTDEDGCSSGQMLTKKPKPNKNSLVHFKMKEFIISRHFPSLKTNLTNASEKNHIRICARNTKLTWIFSRFRKCTNDYSPARCCFTDQETAEADNTEWACGTAPKIQSDWMMTDPRAPLLKLQFAELRYNNLQLLGWKWIQGREYSAHPDKIRIAKIFWNNQVSFSCETFSICERFIYLFFFSFWFHPPVVTQTCRIVLIFQFQTYETIPFHYQKHKKEVGHIPEHFASSELFIVYCMSGFFSGHVTNCCVLSNAAASWTAWCLKGKQKRAEGKRSEQKQTLRPQCWLKSNRLLDNPVTVVELHLTVAMEKYNNPKIQLKRSKCGTTCTSLVWTHFDIVHKAKFKWAGTSFQVGVCNGQETVSREGKSLTAHWSFSQRKSSFKKRNSPMSKREKDAPFPTLLTAYVSDVQVYSSRNSSLEINAIAQWHTRATFHGEKVMKTRGNKIVASDHNWDLYDKAGFQATNSLTRVSDVSDVEKVDSPGRYSQKLWIYTKMT